MRARGNCGTEFTGLIGRWEGCMCLCVCVREREQGGGGGGEEEGKKADSTGPWGLWKDR